jgi:hypothetical protein
MMATNKHIISEINKIINTKCKGEEVAILLTLWHGDTMEYGNGVYLDIVICPVGKDTISTNIECSSTLDDTDENVEIIKKEQHKLSKHLAKHYGTVIVDEQHV